MQSVSFNIGFCSTTDTEDRSVSSYVQLPNKLVTTLTTIYPELRFVQVLPIFLISTEGFLLLLPCFAHAHVLVSKHAYPGNCTSVQSPFHTWAMCETIHN